MPRRREKIKQRYELDAFEKYQLRGHIIRGLVFQPGQEGELELACAIFPRKVVRAKRRAQIVQQ